MMATSDQQEKELFKLITELDSPLDSPYFDTVVKRPKSEGDTNEKDITEQKVPYESDSSDSDIDIEPASPILDVKNILRQIEDLKKEQEELWQKQRDHQMHIQELLDREPSVNQRFESWRNSWSSQTNTKYPDGDSSRLPINKLQSILTEEHIYVQLEQLYANLHRLHLPHNKPHYSAEEAKDTKAEASDLNPSEVTFKWTIFNYTEKLKREKANEGHKEVSVPFYLTHCGYRAQIEAYLNGNGTGTNRCLSVFLRIVKGDYDNYLKWPAHLHLVMILVNQSDDHTDSLKADGNEFEYKKPQGLSDNESDCWGLIEFVSHEMIKQRQYIKDNKIELKCRVQLL